MWGHQRLFLAAPVVVCSSAADADQEGDMAVATSARPAVGATDKLPPVVKLDTNYLPSSVRIADAGCTVDPGKPKRPNGPPSSAPSAPQCPIDTTSIGGAEEHSGHGETQMQSLLYSETNFASPIYQTLRGQLFGQTAFETSWQNEDLFKAGGAKIGSRYASGLAIEQFLRYGVTDSFSLAAQIDDNPISIVKFDRVDGRQTKAGSEGWSNPTFYAIDRLLSERDDPIYLDVRVGYSPSAFAAGQNLQMEERAGFVTGDLTLQLDSITTYNWAVGSSQGGPYWDETLGLHAFYELSTKWSVNGRLGYDISPGQSRDGQVVLHGQFNYFVVPERLELVAEYQHKFVRDTVTEQNRGADTVGLRFYYLFNLLDPGG